MALQKQSVAVNFDTGLDTKADPYQVSLNKFQALSNSVFDTQGRLTKRNGFPIITTLPNATQTTLTTLNDNLLATGSNLYAYSENTDQWLNQGIVQPVNLSVQPLVRVSTSQSSPDSAVSSDGLTCLVYVDGGIAYYQISDSNTGQQIVARTSLGATATNPRVTILGAYFIISYAYTNSGTPNLAMQAIPIAAPATIGSVIQISNQITAITSAYDMVVLFNTLYFAWNGSDGSLKLRAVTTSFLPFPITSIAATQATIISLTADIASAKIWLSWWYATSTNGFTTAYADQLAAAVVAPTQIITAVTTVNAMTSVATGGTNTVFYQTQNSYAGGYPTANTRSDYISKVSCNLTPTVVGPTVVLRSVGLASRAFIASTGVIYMLATYGATTSPTLSNQPSYFLIDSTGAIYMRLAYSNGGGYAATQVLPSVSLVGTDYKIPYLIKDFLAAVNKGTNNPSGTPSNAIYTQTGINLATFSINTSGQYSSEIASTLHLTGGQLWMYDGVRPVEHGFHVYPENVAVSTSGAGGSITAQQYYYQFCYEWTDNQGNLHRSAPSIPVSVTTTGATSTNTIYVPTLRMTYKISPNPVRIVGYRWSVAQQTYYQFTSLTSPTANSTSSDLVTITDTLADSAILGQTLLYTTGGVVEHIAAPANIASALFKNRLFLVDAEDRNLLWYSKQVIESVPVEMSDLLTIYVAPTSGAQGSTGPITALSAMDDKLIVFKQDAIYYITGTGPDNTGASNDFSDPIFITSSVGCANPNSIVLMPNGIMFQSDKGIWMLGRDLSTKYIGADVEAYNAQTVTSAQNIPGTNQVRFILGNNITLIFDYYYSQWGTFTNLQAISATLYQSKHTYLNSLGQVLQETPGSFLDGSTPVLMSFTTSWVNIAGIRGYERFYEMLLLGTYYTPFKLNVEFSYDYSSNPSQAVIVSPDNYTPGWGGDAQWGSAEAWGGVGNVFQARVFPQIQKCETFQITINEIYDSTYGVAAGNGLTLSGLNLVVGIKKGWSTQKASRSFG